MSQSETKSTPQIIAYLRISTREQDLNSQKLELHEYARRNDIGEKSLDDQKALENQGLMI